jgi:hypothetical protein
VSVIGESLGNRRDLWGGGGVLGQTSYEFNVEGSTLNLLLFR